MKLNKETLKKMIQEVIEEDSMRSMLLESPLLTETTFNRIKDKIDNSDIPFIFISADRHEYDRAENNKRYKNLKKDLISLGIPFAEVQGSWIETAEDGSEHRVIEKSVVAYEEDRGDVEPVDVDLWTVGKELCAKYKQDAFIYGEVSKKTGQRHINAYDENGQPVQFGGPWNTLQPIEKDASFWSKVRGSTFVFDQGPKIQEVVDVEAPNSVIEAYGLAAKHGKNVKFVRRANEES